MTLSASNTFTGNIIVTGGTLVASLNQSAVTNPTSSALGNLSGSPASHDHSGPGRHAGLRPTATSLGVAARPGAPNLVINQGTVTNTAAGNAHNYLGPQLTLNGGTLTGTAAAVRPLRSGTSS